MLQSLKLVGVGPAPEMEMQFAPRLNVMTGDNGLGKSLFLETIWFALTGNWAGDQAYPNGDLDGARIKYQLDENRVEEAGFAKMENRWHWAPNGSKNLVIYARVDGSVSIWDPLRTFERRSGRTGTIFHFSPDEILNGFRAVERVIARGLIEDWVTWQEKRPETPGGRVFANLSQILEMVSPNAEAGEIIRPVTPLRMLNDARTFPTIDTGYGPIRIIHASAAMRRIVGLAYLITWAWHEHVEEARQLKEKPASNLAFLMDEVENHLHPEWQRRILPALLKVLESLGDGMQVQMHVTTHSPMVLASLEPHWKNELDELFVFSLKDGHVSLESDELGRCGTSSRWLTSRVFRLHRDRSVEAERAMDTANAVMAGEQAYDSKMIDELDAELRRTLPGQDPFWPRWRIFMGDPEK